MFPSRRVLAHYADFASRRATLAAWSNVGGVAGWFLFLAALGAPLRGQERLVRTFGPENGLTSPPVWALAQDSVGFIWIGTEGGLFRFDGTEFRRWAADSIREAVWSITVSPDGRITVLSQPGQVYEITASGARGFRPHLAGRATSKR